MALPPVSPHPRHAHHHSPGHAARGKVAEARHDVVTVLRSLLNGTALAGRVVWSFKTGDEIVLKGDSAPYPVLSPNILAAARARGKGQVLPQPFIGHHRDGKQPSEPVNLVVHGSKMQLVQALESQGWKQAQGLGLRSAVRAALSVLTRTVNAPNAPVSHMYLDGKPAAMAFSKNSDHNLSRDHLRIWQTGIDPHGEPIWAIAATRDTSVHLQGELHVPLISFRGGKLRYTPRWPSLHMDHGTDKAGIDGERDLIMLDLLHSGRVQTWSAVEGQRKLTEQRLRDGFYQVNGYTTDGKMFDVRLR